MYRILYSSTGRGELERRVQDALEDGATLVGGVAYDAVGGCMQAVNTADAPAKTMGEFNNQLVFSEALAAHINNGYTYSVSRGSPISHHKLALIIQNFLIERGIN